MENENGKVTYPGLVFFCILSARFGVGRRLGLTPGRLSRW